MLEWATHLKLRFLCSPANPITTMPAHLTQIPLIIRFKFELHMPTLFREKLALALQNRDRVCEISIKTWGLDDLGLYKALGNAFPVLETLSLDGVHTRQGLPFDFVAPHLRALHLRSIDRHVSMECFKLSLTNPMNLSSLRLDTFKAIPLKYLVESIASMPHLENISIEFQEPSPPDTVMELWSTQITCVVLPRLSRLVFKGFGTYLENLLTQINTPFLQDLRFTVILMGIRSPSLVRLSGFLGTLQNLKFQTAAITFNRRFLIITYHSDQPSVGPQYATFVIISSPNRHGGGAHSGVLLLQICNAVAPALSVVESLALKMNSADGDRSGFMLQPTFWHTFLRLFVGVKTLTIDVPLVVEISDALCPDNGAVITELLPVLSELVLVCLEDSVLFDQPFSSFVDARRLAGSPIDIRVVQHRPPSFHPPPISWSFDHFFTNNMIY